MKVIMIRKVTSAVEWYNAVGELRYLLGREPQKEEAVVEKEIALTDKEFTAFESDLLAYSEIIKKHKDLMRVDENEVWHCIAVTSKKANYRILVESEGYDYARYTAIVQK